jgi:hypothetical protein
VLNNIAVLFCLQSQRIYGVRLLASNGRFENLRWNLALIQADQVLESKLVLSDQLLLNLLIDLVLCKLRLLLLRSGVRVKLTHSVFPLICLILDSGG